MASSHGYITVANLEDYCGRDFSAIDPAYDDALIEGRISVAEEMVIEAEGTTHTSSIPAKTSNWTKYVAKELMKQQMIDDNYYQMGMTARTVLDMQKELADMFKSEITESDTTQHVFVQKG